MVIGAKGFAAKVWVFESVDVRGMDTLSRSEDVEFVGGEWRWMKKRGKKWFLLGDRQGCPPVFFPAERFLVGSQDEGRWGFAAIDVLLLCPQAEFLCDKL